MVFDNGILYFQRLVRDVRRLRERLKGFMWQFMKM